MCVVMASGGYPDHYEKGKPITGIDEAEADSSVVVFHAGTRREGEAVVTSGGRVLGVTCAAPALETARQQAYRAVDRIRFEGAHVRRDLPTAR
jgi:phosphoribosylamine--glycine ligase